MKNQILSMLPWKPIAIGATALLSSLSTANAVITIAFAESGNDVTISVSGSIDTGGQIVDNTSFYGNVMHFIPGFMVVSYELPAIDTYLVTNISTTGVTPIASSLLSYSGTGSVGLIFANSSLGVPSGYTSGSTLSDTATLSNAQLSSLGLSVGQTSTFTFDIGTATDQAVTFAVIPEPSSFVLLVGCGALAFTLRRRR